MICSSSHNLSLAFSLHEAAAYLQDKAGQEQAVLFLLQLSARFASSGELALADLMRRDCQDDTSEINTEELDDMIMSVAELLELRSTGS